MTHTPKKKLVIANAIIWAAMMLASSLVIQDERAGSTMLMLLVMGWFASSLTFSNMQEHVKAECKAVKRFLQR